MIRTGYLRWEIDVEEYRSKQDTWSNEVKITARPTYRNVVIKWTPRSSAEKAFIQGTANYAEVLESQTQEPIYIDVVVQDIGPRIYRYNIEDRTKMPRYWMEKLTRFCSGFAAEVVSGAASYSQLVISSPILRMNYARMVETEILRVVNGISKPKPTIIDEKAEIDVTVHQEGGIPELVAAELVRDVFEPSHFEEFCHKNYVTLKSNNKTYRIHRRTHALIDVWDEDNQPEKRLCVVFQDPGMPPSDEVAMKYLLVKHDIESLWNIGIKFPFPKNNKDSLM